MSRTLIKTGDRVDRLNGKSRKNGIVLPYRKGKYVMVLWPGAGNKAEFVPIENLRKITDEDSEY
ncbi:MAG: hypothetical protein Q4B86_07340 [Eubacteriales bacterium]|nr:hypothetical protein [Eubacteriales bacterium]